MQTPPEKIRLPFGLSRLRLELEGIARCFDCSVAAFSCIPNRLWWTHLGRRRRAA